MSNEVLLQETVGSVSEYFSDSLRARLVNFWRLSDFLGVLADVGIKF